MEHHTTTSRAEAERLLGIAQKLLSNKDLVSCKDFAVLAQETEPLLDGSDQILAVAEVLSAAEKRVNNQNDWYSILQISHRTDDSELIKKQYRRLALLLHPDKNKFAYADSAFRLVADAWAVLSDPSKKSLYDNEFNLFTKVDLVAMKRQKDLQQQRTPQRSPRQQQQNQAAGGDFSHSKLPVRRSGRGINNRSNANNGLPASASGGAAARRSNLSGGNNNNNTNNVSNGAVRGEMRVNFWTACPYCYNLYEYPRIYEGCCLRCQNCERAFTGMEISSMPPVVQGKDAYYCCWGFFPMGFSGGDLDDVGKSADVGGFPNWMPPMFSSADGAAASEEGVGVAVESGGGGGNQENEAKLAEQAAKKRGRGRPRKNVM